MSTPNRGLIWTLAALGQFVTLTTYYLLRPLRETIGATDGGARLPWLFSATFLVMLVASPALGWLCGRFPRRVWMPLLFHLATASLLFFFGAWKLNWAPGLMRSVFYVWTSLFGLMTVSILWSVLSDRESHEAAARSFGPIAAGSSLGALAGPLISSQVATQLGPQWLFLLSAIGVQCALWILVRIDRRDRDKADASDRSQRLPGAWWSGVSHLLRQRRLRGIAFYVFCLTCSSTIYYFIQASIVDAQISDEVERLNYFAKIDLYSGIAALMLQLFVAGRFVARWGRAQVLLTLPAISLLGLMSLAVAPSALLFALVQSARRAVQYGLAKPVREMLYTDVSPTDRYRTKSAIDLLVYRGGDVVSAWLFAPTVAALGPIVGAHLAPVVGFSPLVALWWSATRGLRDRATSRGA